MPDANRLDLHLWLHHDNDSVVLAKLDRILIRLGVVERQETIIMTTIADIHAQADKTLAAIAVESDKDNSIIALVTANTALITSLKEQLAAAIAGGNQADLQAVLDQLTAAEASALANSEKVVAAVNANTSS